MEKQYTVNEIGMAISKNPDTVREYLRTGILKGTKQPKGGWLISESDYQEYKTGKKPEVASEKSKAILEADDRKAIAEARKAEAEANALEADMTPLELLEAVKKLREDRANFLTIVAEKVEKESGVQLDAAANTEGELKEANYNLREQVESLSNQNRGMREDLVKQATNIKSLTTILVGKEANEVKRLDNSENYKANVHAAIKLITKAHDYISKLDDFGIYEAMRLKKHIEYLRWITSDKWLVEYEKSGMTTIERCNTSLLSLAGYYQDCDDETGFFRMFKQKPLFYKDAASNHLIDVTDKLEKLMRIPDKRTGERDAVNTPAKALELLGKIVDKVGAN